MSVRSACTGGGKKWAAIVSALSCIVACTVPVESVMSGNVTWDLPWPRAHLASFHIFFGSCVASATTVRQCIVLSLAIWAFLACSAARNSCHDSSSLRLVHWRRAFRALFTAVVHAGVQYGLAAAEGLALGTRAFIACWMAVVIASAKPSSSLSDGELLREILLSSCSSASLMRC